MDNIKVRKGEYCTVSARVLDGVIELCQQFFNYEFRDQVSIFFHENYHLKNDKSWSSDNSIRLESPITLTNIPSNIKEYLSTYIEREYKDIWFNDALRKKEFESIIILQ